MKQVIIGLPRSLFFYYDGDLWKNFFENLNCKVIISPHTTKEIIKTGSAVAQDEMCLSFKNYLGHIAYLQNKCDYIVVPRIDNYGIGEQTCTNFLASYDIVHNLFATKIINYNINLAGKETEFKAFKKMGEKFEKDKKKVKWAYYRAKEKSLFQFEQDVNNNIAKLKSKKKKILIVGHPYNVHDTYIGKPIMNILEKLNVEIIYSDLFSKAEARKESFFLCHDLYWKYSKEIIGPIKMIEKQIDGVLFLSSFPCGLDSLVNELVIRKLNLPYLSLVIDDIDSLIGFETRIESFIDIVERVKEYA